MGFMDTKHSPYEIQLLLLCTKVSLTPDDILTIQTLSSKISTPYKTLIALAYKHAVVSQLYHTCKTYLPKHPIVSVLKPYYFNIVQTNMAMASELIQITHLFHSQQIPTLSFKGASLATQIYGDITLRQYGDLDILIKKQDKDKALALLHKAQFTPEINLLSHTKKTFFSAVNVLGFHSPKKHIFVELHWELLSKNYAIHWEESHLWEKTENVYINQQILQTLSHTNHFLYLCTHGSKHLYERLAWVSDIDHYIQTQNNLDWEEVLKEAKRLGITRILYLSLFLVKSLLGTPLPHKVTKKMSQDLMAKKLAEQLISLHFTTMQQKGKSVHSFVLLWQMRENTSDKLRFAWHALFSTKLDDFRFIQLPNYLAFLYPLLRPFRLMLKYLK
jgi:hypothetical protein